MTTTEVILIQKIKLLRDTNHQINKRNEKLQDEVRRLRESAEERGLNDKANAQRNSESRRENIGEG
jgi:uncharacterized protein YlxW (UPF0749 family)